MCSESDENDLVLTIGLWIRGEMLWLMMLAVGPVTIPGTRGARFEGWGTAGRSAVVLPLGLGDAERDDGADCNESVDSL